MSLAHKFSWQKFLKLHPEYKKKKIKRTSPEGEKAFKTAFKEFAKNWLKERQEKIKKEKERVTKTKKGLLEKLKGVEGKKWHLKAKNLNREIGRFDAYLSRLEQEQKRSVEQTKQL